MTTKYNKTWLEKEIAKRSGFRIADIREVLNIYQEIVEQIVYNKGKELKGKKIESHSIEVLKIANMFTLCIKKIGEHQGWDGIRKQKLFIPVTYRVVFSPSENLLRFLREGDLIEEEFDEEE